MGDAQQSVAEGPVPDALRSGCPVWVEDLEEAVGRWPLPAAGTAPGFRSYAVLPVLPRPQTTEPAGVLGTLEVAHDAFGLPPARRRVALDLALLLASSLLARDPQLVLAGALPDHLDTAVGILRGRLRIDATEALARPRAEAFTAGPTVHQVARRLVREHERAGPGPV